MVLAADVVRYNLIGVHVVLKCNYHMSKTCMVCQVLSLRRCLYLRVDITTECVFSFIMAMSNCIARLHVYSEIDALA